MVRRDQIRPHSKQRITVRTPEQRLSTEVLIRLGVHVYPTGLRRHLTSTVIYLSLTCFQSSSPTSSFLSNDSLTLPACLLCLPPPISTVKSLHTEASTFSHRVPLESWTHSQCSLKCHGLPRTGLQHGRAIRIAVSDQNGNWYATFLVFNWINVSGKYIWIDKSVRFNKDPLKSYQNMGTLSTTTWHMAE